MTRVAEESDRGRPVSRLVSPAMGRLAGLVVLLALICVVGVLVLGRALGDLTDDVQPAWAAHERVEEGIADLESHVAAWTLTGDVQRRAAFDEGVAEVTAAIDDLRVLDAADDLETALDAEAAAAEAWLDEYAVPAVAAPGGSDALDPELVAVGQQLSLAYGDARGAAEDALRREFDRAGDAATLRLRLTILATLLVAGAAVLLIGRTRSRLLAELSDPLLALEQVVQRMLKNDPDGRAAATLGPKEVRSVARALNDFADAQSRARAVEGRIQDELHVLDSAKDDFVSNVSHELRTPLTTISGYLEMVADEFDGQLEPRHDRMLEATRRNVVRLRALIDDLLALSKAENRPTELEPSDVTEMVTDAVTDVRISAARRGISVEVAATDEAMLVVCDRAMLYRAFLNVLTNAVKFSHDDGTVEVTVTRVGDRVEVAIRDHGIGIPRTELDRLGTRFFRASNAMTNEIAGTGLGLRIVQTIVDKHAGDVVIESAEGEGTTVFVRLRLHEDRVAPVPRLTAAKRVDEGV